MKDLIKFYIKYIIWVLLHLLYIFPVDAKKIFFRSMLGTRYSCNPKYIYLYTREKFGDSFKYTWELKSKNNDILHDGQISIVKNKTFKVIFEMMTSKYIIDNASIFWWIPFRDNQIILETWHGGGAYKRVGSGVAWNNKKYRLYQIEKESDRITYYISSSIKFTEVQSQSKHIPMEKFINTGMPRNQVFFYPELLTENRLKVLNYYRLKFDIHILLYAPTYRGIMGFKNKAGKKGFVEPDYEMLIDILMKKYGGIWKILYRGHNYDYDLINKLPDSVIDATKYEDMQELLCSADVLVTDFSSSMWDFGLTKRPCFLYAPDLQQYISDRGFYTDPFSWPFPMAQSDDELARNILDFDQAAYEKALEKHYSDFGSYENKDACAKVCQAIGIE